KKKEWDAANAEFSRDDGNRWSRRTKLPEKWTIDVDGITFKISPTDFGHLGIFPEQKQQWRWIHDTIKNAKNKPKVLNLFAYSGGTTLAAARAGAEVCHLDASKGMVAWARENAALNKLEDAPIRWIVDDVTKFLDREMRRGNQYDAIVLDPPSFGRGSRGEIFKIEEDLTHLLKQCKKLLTPKPLFLLLSCHTPGYTPITLENIMTQMMHDKKGTITAGEMCLEGEKDTFHLPSGTYVRWSNT
ncbi:MAG: methyltransferase domain-containing protein, partial [Waddliaceae bacterium]|nr:methyltransferase domain-containing protein [Waddliaceae bacterium]